MLMLGNGQDDHSGDFDLKMDNDPSPFDDGGREPWMHGVHHGDLSSNIRLYDGSGFVPWVQYDFRPSRTVNGFLVRKQGRTITALSDDFSTLTFDWGICVGVLADCDEWHPQYGIPGMEGMHPDDVFVFVGIAHEHARHARWAAFCLHIKDLEFVHAP